MAGIAQDITAHESSLVYVVDDGEASRRDVFHLLQGAGYDVKGFAPGQAFLEVAPALAAGCVLLNMRAPGAEGLAILRDMKARGIDLPVIVTGERCGDAGLGVAAMKAGAVDFLEAPYEPETLLTAVATALADIRVAAEHDQAVMLARARIAGMSPREREVLDGLLAGGTNKTIARELKISSRTVEFHRAHVMERLGARTLPEAVLIAAAAGLRPPQAAKAPVTRASARAGKSTWGQSE